MCAFFFRADPPILRAYVAVARHMQSTGGYKVEGGGLHPLKMSCTTAPKNNFQRLLVQYHEWNIFSLKKLCFNMSNNTNMYIYCVFCI